MELTEEKIIEKKEEIEKIKGKLSELKGEEKGLLRELKEEWDCYNLDEVKVKLKAMDKDLIKLNEEIEEKIFELEEKMNNDEN